MNASATAACSHQSRCCSPTSSGRRIIDAYVAEHVHCRDLRCLQHPTRRACTRRCIKAGIALRRAARPTKMALLHSTPPIDHIPSLNGSSTSVLPMWDGGLHRYDVPSSRSSPRRQFRRCCCRGSSRSSAMTTSTSWASRRSPPMPDVFVVIVLLRCRPRYRRLVLLPMKWGYLICGAHVPACQWRSSPGSVSALIWTVHSTLSPR